jgi:hypothetical protein
MKNNFPSFNEYQAVLQNPAVCFGVHELKSGAVETDLWGLPRVRSGGFALTYKVVAMGRSIAVRCFHRPVADRGYRYTAISNFLLQNPSEFFVPVRFLANGIQVRGNWYPITYMRWVEGDTLEAYVVKNVHSRDRMHALSGEVLRLVTELERLGAAHGDLSHRNILVQNGRMLLVDYDGMYVPELIGKKSCEVGNIHFQLPSRTEKNFNPDLDRFSAIVIYLAFEALSRNPLLWERYETGGEGLMFQRNDFINPYQSALLQEIEVLPGLKPLVDQFRHICTSDISRVPRLKDFIEARPMELVRSEMPVPPPPQAPVYDAAFRVSLLVKAGKLVTVVGQVTEVHRGISKGGEPHVFLNFGNWRGKCFTIVLWNEALQLLETTGRNPDEYLNRWVSVSGMMNVYERRPQIAVYSPTDIHFLKDEAEARTRIENARPHRVSAANGPAASMSTVANRVQSAIRASGRTPAPGPAVRSPAELPRVTGSLDQPPTVLASLDRLYSGSQASPETSSPDSPPSATGSPVSPPDL